MKTTDEIRALLTERHEYLNRDELLWRLDQLEQAILAEAPALLDALDDARLSIVAGEALLRQEAQRVEKAESKLKEARHLLKEIWLSMPATYDGRDPMVQRHEELVESVHSILLTP